MSAPRILCWWPGATVAVADVATGLVAGLQAHGCELQHYRTDAHIVSAGYTLQMLYKQAKRGGCPAPSPADVLYEANKGILERALRLQPDWVISVSGMYQHPDYYALLRRAGLRVALLCTESPYDLAAELALAPHVDALFTNERSALAAFRTKNPNSYYLRHAWVPGVHDTVTPEADTPRHDVVFVGTGFVERCRLLSAIDWTGIDVGIYGTWQLIGPRAKVRRHVRLGDVKNTQTTRLYKAATVGLNLHRTSVRYGRQVPHVRRAESLNPRCYELAACGVPFVTDARAEVREVFGDAVPTFSTPVECEAAIRRLLADEAYRQDVSGAAREAVAGETWTARAAQVLDVLYRAQRRAA